jgi:hypothetical protein
MVDDNFGTLWKLSDLLKHDFSSKKNSLVSQKGTYFAAAEKNFKIPKRIFTNVCVF